MAVSPNRRVRRKIRQGRAHARFVRGIWLGKTTESHEHLFATDTREYTTRTVKRVPDTEQRRADLVKSFAKNAVQQACRTPSGKTSQDQLFKHRPLRHLQQPKQVSDRVKMQANAAVRMRKISFLQSVARVIPVPRAADKTRRMNRAQHPDPRIPTTRALVRIGPVTITRRSDRGLRLRAVKMTERIRVTTGVCNQRVRLNSRKAT